MRLGCVVLLFAVGCEDLDPRATCGWDLDIVETEGLSVDLSYPDNVSCTPPESAPDRLLVEAVVVDDEPYTGDDLAVVCDSGNHYTALQVEGLAEGSHAYLLFADDQPGEITMQNPALVSDTSWVHVTYMQTSDDGSARSEESWAAYIKQGADGQIVPARECYERG